MIDQIIATADKIEITFKTLKFGFVLSLLLNIIITVILFKITDLFIKKLKEHSMKTDSSVLSIHLIPILDRIIKFIILFVVIASFLQSNGYSITSLIAGFGITGLAVGFAAQQTIADFFGTLAIIADKIYKLGDYIKIGDVEGTVEDINLLSTKIRTLDDFVVTIPNNNISAAVITNISKAHRRRICEVFGVTYSTNSQKLTRAIEIIKETCDFDKRLHKDSIVVIDELAESSINIKLFAYVKTNNYNEFIKIKSDVILDIIEKFRAEGIDFAFPSQSIYIEKNEN